MLLRYGSAYRYSITLDTQPEKFPGYFGIDGIVAITIAPTKPGFLALTAKGILVAPNADGKLSWDLRGGTSRISQSGLLVAGGEMAAYRAKDGKIALYHPELAVRKRLVPLDLPNVRALAMSRDGKWLAAASGGADGKGLIVWKTEDLKESRNWKCPPTEVLALSADGTIAAGCAGTDGKVWLYDTETGKELQAVEAPGDVLRFLEFLPKGNTLAAAGKAGVIHLWDARTGKTTGPGSGHTGAVRGVAYTPDGGAVTAAADCTARLWDATGKEVRKFEGHKGALTALVLSADAKTLFTASSDGTVRAWDVAKGTELRKFEAGEGAGAVLSLALSPDGKTLAAGLAKSVVHLLETDTLKPTKMFGGYGGTVALGYAGTRLVTRDRGNVIYVLDPAKETELRRFSAFAGNTDSAPVAISSDCKTVASPVGDEKQPGSAAVDLGIWEVESGKLLDLIQVGRRENELSAVAYLPGGKAVVVGDTAGKVWVIDLEKKAVRGKFEGHRGPVLCLAVSLDGKTVASGSADTTVLVWDLDKAR